jgi:hypothetical protein
MICVNVKMSPFCLATGVLQIKCMMPVILLQIPFYPPQQTIEDFSPKVSSTHKKRFIPIFLTTFVII